MAVSRVASLRSKSGPVSPAAPCSSSDTKTDLKQLIAKGDQFIRSTPATGQQVASPSGAALLKYQIWPLAGAPEINPSVDQRLGSTGLMARILMAIDQKAPWLSNGIRKFSRFSGPPMYWVSGLANGILLLHDWHNPSFKPGTKVALAAGTGLTFAGAAAATWAALPVKGALLANRFSGFFGGAAGGIFGALNMIVTLNNKKATPTEKVSATGGFVLGTLATVVGTAAVFLPAGTALGPLGLGIWAAIVGGASTALAVTQLLFGKNKWLNKELSVAGKDFGRAEHTVASWGHKLLSWL